MNGIGGGNARDWKVAVIAVLVTLAVVLTLMYTGLRIETGKFGDTSFINIDVGLVDSLNNWRTPDATTTTVTP